ncbi:RNA polymerase factor sigma-54 [Spectribacter hydrogenoxidans]|uniref:RNA polymerase sigma-54 factor n=1 Tax=Spectribacter hydrogenoxidans TaxID=3075608 RepID=A0ABU3BX11_9GAMM|nr:RNA polymerase factor sigma-54 [Salinisphaera sp. W335]MDT0633843.1 RNA polymerase factor sigma-54 [Salinisphaera sp. W335]
MSLKQSVSLKLGQSLTMTPALQQAIRMLQLSTLDLSMEIQQALDSNVMLETEEPEEQGPDDAANQAEETRPAGEDIPENLPVDADWDDIYQSAPARQASAEDEALWEYRQANLHTPPDLHEHLTWQAELAGFGDTQALVAAYLIDAVDNHGYLQGWPELAERLTVDIGADEAQLTAVLTTIQAFDPPGVAARSLQECLLIQLDQVETDAPGLAAARAIVERDGLEALGARDHTALARLSGIDDADELATGMALIQTLQPHPGEAYGGQEAQYIVPEVFVVRREGRWQVQLNPDIAPRLRINPQYMAMVKRADKSADQTTLKEHLQEARFFLNSLRSRNETLLRVAQCIVEAQRAFLEYGEEAMKPLVLRDVADALDIHESTVSRATAHKYMQTPRGLFELKYFFSSHVATTDGGTCSATAIQAMIRRLVAGETPGKPLSDSRLADLLLDEGIQVARRTVAKYREAMSIPPSHQRRRQHA